MISSRILFPVEIFDLSFIEAGFTVIFFIIKLLFYVQNVLSAGDDLCTMQFLMFLFHFPPFPAACSITHPNFQESDDSLPLCTLHFLATQSCSSHNSYVPLASV